MTYSGCMPEKLTQNALHVASSKIGRFSKFFHCYNLPKIRNAAVIKYPTTPVLKRLATLHCEMFMSEI